MLLGTSHCDVTMSNDVAMCTYHGITMHNDVAMNLFYCVFSALYLIMILLWVVWNKNKNKFMLDQSGLGTHDLFLYMAISLVLWPREISLHKHNSCVIPRLIKHSLVLVIVLHTMAFFLWSPAMWFLDWDHMAGTMFLYKIVLTSPEQKQLMCSPQTD